MDAPQASLYYAVLITAIVLGLIIAYFVVSLIRQHRRTISMHQERLAAEITALEKERSRMAADLHDELGPVLLAVKYNVNSFDLHNEEDRETLEKTNDTIDRMIRQMREISNDLMPQALVRKGWITALTELIEPFQRSGKLQISLRQDPVPEFKLEKSVQLFRISQEIVHNTIKHSGASQLELEINIHADQLHIKARDNGNGFDLKSTSAETSGHGLKNLLSRTDLLGGFLYLDSAPGKGTQYYFEIPLQNLLP